jgi:hypothetical protein
VEILAIEKFSLAALDPLGASQRLTLWTVAVSAGAVADALVAALIALLDLSPESRRPTHTSIAVMTRRCAVDIDAPYFSR